MYGNEPFNKSDLVWNYFHEHPSEEVTPKKLAQKLDINYNTANSAINRLYISGKIKKKMRGVYVLFPSLPRGQVTLDELLREDMAESEKRRG
ncbi:MAG: hypothetical protein U9Q37_07215 [Euryarchaeota archaeon]|nr:hypothetical protein [Euryarchaeota archaeon]